MQYNAMQYNAMQCDAMYVMYGMCKYIYIYISHELFISV